MTAETTISQDAPTTHEGIRAFVAEVARITRAAVGDELALAFEVGSPVEQRWLGLRRYWQKQEEAASA